MVLGLTSARRRSASGEMTVKDIMAVCMSYPQPQWAHGLRMVQGTAPCVCLAVCLSSAAQLLSCSVPECRALRTLCAATPALEVPVWCWSVSALWEGAEPPRKAHREPALPCPAEGWQWRHRRLCVATGSSCWLGDLFALKMLYFLQTQLDVKVSGYEFVQRQTLVTPQESSVEELLF